MQGVGFRPFVYRLASEMKLSGWVSNSAQGVFIEVEGDREALDEFLLRLGDERPPRAIIQGLECSLLDAVGYHDFMIRPSDAAGARTVLVLPDIATCADCLSEILDPADRHYRYAFTNCTNCGPRYSIIRSLPYDRANTSMRSFRMCDLCASEYENPEDRRFHAQPNACPLCGPRLELWDRNGRTLSRDYSALQDAVEGLRHGDVVAVKGLGGFHILVDARSGEAVENLRVRKQRGDKPFAVMYPSIDAVEADCQLERLERRVLLSPESPIVLLLKRTDTCLSVTASAAPGNPYLGVMLPYTPLHHLLTRAAGFPVIATSGNLTEEPICTDEEEALIRLREIADIFLVHNRPIVRHVDDSIVRIMLGRELVMRRARGYAPLPVTSHRPLPALLAVGAHLKNTVALSIDRNVFVSQHIGDLENKETMRAFRAVVRDLQSLYQTEPSGLAADAHPDYLSTQFARAGSKPFVQVQHHYAHVCSCMSENELEGQVLGVSWDGTGYGLDGNVWGGEFLLTSDTGFRRVATFREFPLPGSKSAVREPRRTALGILYEIMGTGALEQRDLHPIQSFTGTELRLLGQMLERRLNSPLTTSAGRLFDAVASLAGLRQIVDFEGQAAMGLEFAVDSATTDAYPFPLLSPAPDSDGCRSIDWEPAVLAVIDDRRSGVAPCVIAARFHNGLVEAIVAVARQTGELRVVLTGGCFQNRYLTERTVRRLQEEGFRPYWHQRVPPNDGGISLGQVVAAARMNR